MIRGLFGFLIVLCFAMQAQAATVGNVKGDVRIGDDSVTSPTSVPVGGIVQTGPNSSATVYFDNGCSAVVPSNQSLTIPENLTCEEGGQLTNDYTALVIGGVVLGGAGLAIALANGSSSSSPVSP